MLTTITRLAFVSKLARRVPHLSSLPTHIGLIIYLSSPRYEVATYLGILLLQLYLLVRKVTHASHGW